MRALEAPMTGSDDSTPELGRDWVEEQTIDFDHLVRCEPRQIEEAFSTRFLQTRRTNFFWLSEFTRWDLRA